MSDEQSRRELEAQQTLQEAGIAIISEDPKHETGGLVRYRIVGKLRDSEEKIAVLGDNRESALTALIIATKSS